jgi:hypothetical protein
VATTQTAPRAFVGQVYGAEWGDILVDLLEQIPDLHFPLSTRTYGQMRNYPQLRGVLAAYCLPIERADWRVDPAGCRDVVVEQIADDLGLPILGQDVKPGPARRRGVSFRRHLRSAVRETLTYGFSPWEKRYDFLAGQFRLADLASRTPQSISNIEVEKGTGALKGARQNTMTSPNDLIAAKSLLWYTHEKEGANWAGRSLLRSAYGPWVLAMEMWRVHGTSIQRFGMGVPGFEPVPGVTVTETQLIEAQKMASKMRAGEGSGYAAPSGFQFKLAGMTGSVPDALAFIRYLDQAMSAQALAGVMDLGATPNGSRALGDVFMDLLLLAVQSVGDDHAEAATTALSVPQVDYNFGEGEAAPRIVCGDVSADAEITADTAATLVQSGALSADPELEAHLRGKYGIPQRDPNAPAPSPGAPVAASRRGRGRPVLAASGLRRQPTELEAAAQTDFAKVSQQWQSALDKLVAEWGPVTEAQVVDLGQQVEAAVRAGDIQALSQLGVDTQDAADLLESAMLDAADEAAQTQADEADAQGVTVDPGAADTGRIAAQAAALAAMLGAGLAIAAGRKAMQAFTPDASPAEVRATVSEYLGSLTDASLKDTLGAGLSFGQSAGRIATLQAAPVAARYAASEILDASTCDACLDEDGYEFADLSGAEAAYASGGYVGCQGGLRCRGIIVTLWDDSSLGQAA